MSILLKWKSKLQDPSAMCENKIREFDERVSFLKNENVRLHERIDQLEALCTTSVDNHQTRCLEEHIRQLEQENVRLSTENNSQRQEYERFLDQLTNMILRTAMMQENIRKECASIYQLIERVSTLTTRAIQDKRVPPIEDRRKILRSLSWEHLTLPCDWFTIDPFHDKSSKTTAEFIRHLCQNHSPSSSSNSLSSCSSTTTHCSFSTSGSWTLDLVSFYDKGSTNPSTILPIPKRTTESISSNNEKKDEPVNLQRSETFVIGKVERDSNIPLIPTIDTPEKSKMTIPERKLNSNVQRCTTTRSIPNSTLVASRPSRLPARCLTNNQPTQTINSSNTKVSATITTTTNRSSSVKQVSKLPVRTAVPPTIKPNVITKKANVPTSAPSKTKKEANIGQTRSVSSNNSISIKKNVRTNSNKINTVNTNNSSSKGRSRSSGVDTTKRVDSVSSANKRTQITTNVVKKVSIAEPVEEKVSEISEQINSTSSNSSIEENQNEKKLVVAMQDEGYSTWSSSDVKDERSSNESKRSSVDERRRTTGLVKNWLNTSNQGSAKKPVNEEKLEEFTRELSDGASVICPFVRNRCSNGIIIPVAVANVSNPVPSILNKDISLDSLEGETHGLSISGKDKTSLEPNSSSSFSTFSPSETFERILINEAKSPSLVDDLVDSTDSTCSDFNQLCAMSEYIEDNLIVQQEHLSIDRKQSDRTVSFKPEKRLLVPGILNRLIFLRRVLSDSDLRQKSCCATENESMFHVYHSETIHEHSIELNLGNTYGSDSELQVWSNDCAEQRSVVNERNLSVIGTDSAETKLSHIERLIQMTLEDPEDDQTNTFEFNIDNYNQQIALERQALLQQIYEYPWLLQDDDIDQPTTYVSPNSDPTLLSPGPDLIVPSHNPDFYQLCSLTNSSSFANSFGTNSRHTTPPITSSVL